MPTGRLFSNVILITWMLTSVAVCQSKKVLIIGDSISLGAYPYLTSELPTWKFHHPGNAFGSAHWYQIHDDSGDTFFNTWLTEVPGVDLISMNAGIWDRNICEIPPYANTPLPEYGQNLQMAIDIIRERTNAKIVWQTTTPVIPNHDCVPTDSHEAFRDLAISVMAENGVLVSDLYAIPNITQYHRAPDDLHFNETGEKLIGHQYATSLLSLAGVFAGDSNLDGRFDSSDLTQVFQIGEFEDGTSENSTWKDGDWNRDREFDTGDLVLAFQDGHFVSEARPAAVSVPEPTGAQIAIIALFLVCRIATRRNS